VKALAGSLENKLEPALITMVKVPWGNTEFEGYQSEYVTQIATVLSSNIPVYHTWLSSSHFKYFCDLFAGSFIPRLVSQIYKLRRISNEGVDRLMVDISNLKTILLEIPNMSSTKGKELLSSPGSHAPSRYTKHVNREIGKADALLKVIVSKNEVLVDTYVAVVPEQDRSESDFAKILDLKSIKGSERQELLDRYLNYGKSSTSSSTIPTSSSTSHSLSIQKEESFSNPLTPTSSSSTSSLSAGLSNLNASKVNDKVNEAANTVVAHTQAFRKLLSDVFDKQSN